MILIAGRTGAGKDTLAEELRKFGLHKVLSYTTRPKRSEDENTHLFITAEQAEKFPAEMRAASTKIGEYEYFATKKQIETEDLYIVDYYGIRSLCYSMPLEKFLLIYVFADREKRMEHACLRGDDPVVEKKRFQTREMAEYRQFQILELLIEQDMLPEQIIRTIILENDYSDGFFAKKIPEILNAAARIK